MEQWETWEDYCNSGDSDVVDNSSDEGTDDDGGDDDPDFSDVDDQVDKCFI